MSTSTSDLQSQATDSAINQDDLPVNSNSTSSDEQLAQTTDGVNLATSSEDPNNNERHSESSTTIARTPGQTAIGAKLVKKLETFAATSKGNKQSDESLSSTAADDETSATANNDPESRRAINKAAKNIMKNLTDSDTQKNLLALAVKIAELQDQQRSLQTKSSELEKRTTTYMRERDHISLENSRLVTARTKLESLCRELQRHNQQIRDESIQQQGEDEVKRRELAAQFQTTIDGIAAQLADYSEKSAALREQNAKLSEQLPSVVKHYDLRQKELETALKKKELELRLTEATIEQSHTLLNERNELVKQEQQVSTAERLVLHKKCEELSASELSLRSQVKMYADRYKEFQSAIQQSTQTVTSCHSEMEKMRKTIKKLENERGDFRRRWEMADQNQRKATEDHTRLEKEKGQLDAKVDKLDKLSRALQQERMALQATILNLTTSPTKTIDSSVTETQTVSDGHGEVKSDLIQPAISDINGPTPIVDSPNLYDSELGRIANTVD